MPANSEIIIRPIAPNDKDAWKQLWRRYLRFYSTIRDDALYEATFQRLADDSYPDMFAFVAEYRGQLVGLVNCIIHDHGWYQDRVVYLQDLFVEESARGRGIGRQLIEKVYERADRTGKASVYWMTQTSNKTAMALYDKVAIKTDFIIYQR
ncbi:GNAT family N-acetyltransferase [Martelella alba]|uniref:GNAT family N-acetyltransferase n=1 Tax=Martelella alba TaxID=2590451 RepID=A0ABY2SLT1_9HYPH|nr:GNAT family N-acetyltransferase [Martelella alba]TKI06734.1 GNAT family N-acetyltransferase [Martelella alba]